MEAIRRIEQLQGDLLSFVLPEYFRGKKVEVIVLPFQEREIYEPSSKRRVPSPRLRGVMEIKDDLTSPATLSEEWDALK